VFDTRYQLIEFGFKGELTGTTRIDDLNKVDNYFLRLVLEKLPFPYKSRRFELISCLSKAMLIASKFNLRVRVQI